MPNKGITITVYCISYCCSDYVLAWNDNIHLYLLHSTASKLNYTLLIFDIKLCLYNSCFAKKQTNYYYYWGEQERAPH